MEKEDLMRFHWKAGMVMATIVAASAAHSKQCSRLVTAGMRQNAMENAKKFGWAKSQQQAAVAAAA
ncbi:MAG: hypothetical protein CO095_19750, partial [Armatimonadetes bacterium CG_4_9_14_3_um_filter_58_7]